MGLTRTQIPLTITFLRCVLSANATTKDTANLITALIQSWEWATFGLLIVAEFFSILILNASIQALPRYIKSKRDGSAKTDSRNVSGAFCCFTILGSFFLMAYYPLFFVQALIPPLFNITSVTHSIIPSGMIILTSDMADITIACAFLTLMRRRKWLHFQGSISLWKTVIDIAIILSMVSLTAVKTALACLLSTYESDSKYQVMINLFHAYTALYLLITINIIISAFLLRRALMRSAIEDEIILTNICLRICPIIGVQGIFRLIYEILISLPTQVQQHIKYDALTFVAIVVKFLAYMFAILYGLRVLFPGKALISIRRRE